MKKIDNLVLKEETLTRNIPENATPILHIAFGVDANFAMGLGVLIFSILKHNSHLPISFHIFTNSLYEKDIIYLKNLTQNQCINIKVYYMNDSEFKNLPTKFVLPTAIYYRFVMADILYEKVDQLLYMDVDILCINSLAELLQINLGSKFAAVIEDLTGMAIKARKRNFGFTSEKYFNSGVMYINTKKWKEYDIGQQALQLCLKTRFRQPAQDVFNLLLQNNLYWMDKKFNFIYNLGFMKNSIPSDTILIHYAGNSKPWQLWGQRHHLTELYHAYQKQTPWKDVPITQPKAYKHARFMAQYHSNHHEEIQSYLWAIKYIYWKTKASLLK